MGVSKQLGLGLVLFLFVPSGAHALDCKRARSPSSKQICTRIDLLKLEEEVEGLLTQRMARADAKGKAKLKKTQEDWLRGRNEECRDLDSCLEAKLRDRIAILKDPALIMERVPAVAAKGYRVATWKSIQYPQLTQVQEKEVQRVVNEQIAAEAKGWSCPDGKGSFTAMPIITDLDSEVFSYRVRIEYSCGEKQDYREESRNFDLNTGAAVTVTELFKEGLAPQAISELVYQGVKLEPRCKDLVAKAPIEFNVLGEDLLTFYPRLSFEEVDCKTEVTMSLRQLKPFIRPGVLGAK